MKITPYILLTIVVLFSSNEQTLAQDLSLFEKKEFRGPNGDTLRYRILFPENYDNKKKYPLVLFLHGSGERGYDNEKQLLHGMKMFVEPANRKKYACIVIAPQCPADASWNSSKANREVTPILREFNYMNDITKPLHLAIELTKSIRALEGVDKKKVFICGLSNGGMGTFEAVYRYPELFKAAAPICGGGDTKSYSKAQAKVDFWVFHGDNDPTVDVKYSREMVARLKELKATVKYTEYPGVGHDSWNNAFAEPDFLPWLLGKHKRG